MTILGDYLHFWQLYKVCENNYLAQITHILGHFCKGVKSFIFGQPLWTFGESFLVALPVYLPTLNLECLLPLCMKNEPLVVETFASAIALCQHLPHSIYFLQKRKKS